MSQTTTELDFWRDVPSVEQEPGPGGPRWAESDVAAPPGGFPVTRRAALQAVAALGGALAINVLSWLPPFRSQPAAARVGTEWLSCAGYGGWPGYNNNTAKCVGAPYSQNYCGNDGWFLQWSGTCFASGPVVVCGDGNPGYYAKNAWRWTHSGTPYRCADGVQYWCGGSEFRICAWPNP